MSVSLNVLTPTGRRQIVRVTLNTSILQILEDVCRKQGFSSNEHDLKHHRRILAPSDTVRFANLPNNAQLELVRSAAVGGADVDTKSDSQLVTIGLQLPSGERCLSDFNADVTLWDILVYWTTNGKEGVLDVADETGVVLEPICVYMRKEVSGETELRKTSLRSLGLVNGKVIIRLLHRSVNVEVKQAFVESLNLRRQQLSNENSHAEVRDAHSIVAHDAEDRSQAVEVNSPIPIDTISTDNGDDGDYKGDSLDKTSMEIECTSSATIVSSSPLQIDNQIDVESDEGIVEVSAPARLVYLDDKGSLLYDLNEVSKPIKDELPEQFFDITMDDVRLLMGDLKRQREDFEDIPLRTSAMRESELLMRLNKYPKSLIRINFPDRLVLQGSFKAVDKVEKIIDFVSSFLANQELEFFLYTTPPKRILNSEERLFEVPLVPAAVVHFGCNTPLDHYLADHVMAKISSPSAVNREVLRKSDSREEPHSHKVARLTHEEQEASCSTWPAPTPHSTARSSSLPLSSQQNPSQGAIPKWFSIGKK